MISFRFHIVSLAAVFMALALGVVLGTAFINDGIVDRLEGDVKKVRAERDDARSELSEWKRFGNDAEKAVLEGRLNGERVFVIVPDELRDTITDKAQAVLDTAGAVRAGVVSLDEAWGEDKPPTDDIAAALGIVGPISIESVTNEAADRLAREFAAGGGPTVGALAEASLVKLDGDPATTPGENARFVIIDNGAPSGLLEPLTRALIAQAPNRVLVADAGPSEATKDSLVGVLRGDPRSGVFSTVDHFDTVSGRVAAVLALREFSRGEVGDYGTCCGADRAAPAG